MNKPESATSITLDEWRRAWRQGLAALLAGSLGYSMYSAIASLFIEPLERQFGWSRGEIAMVHGFGLITAFVAPVIGRMTDRLGVRPVLLGGLLMTAFSYTLLSQVNGSLAYYYAVYLVFSIAGMATTGITVTRILSGAFVQSRGSALAIGRAGLAVTGAAVPFVLYPAIDWGGAAAGYLLLAALILVFAVPAVWLFVPARAASLRHSGRVLQADRWFTLLARPKVRVLIAASVFNYMPVVMLLSQMKPLAVSKGLDAATALGAVSVMGVSAAAGALLCGILVDRFWAPAVACVLNVLPAIGCLFLLASNVDPWIFYGALIMVGIGQGAEIDVVAFMIARYFGLKSYSSIYGLSTLGIALSASIGAAMIGYAYDRFGNYDLAITAASASFALAAMLYLAMGRYPASIPD